MRKDIKNIEASIRAQLQNKAKELNRPFAEILQYYGMERFLYRLSKSEYANKFILKGALMFTVWQVPERRSTLDIDFLARFDNQVTSIKKAIDNVCSIEVVPDGLVFDSKTITCQRIMEDAAYEGVRVRMVGFLERSRIPLQIDINFGDIIYPGPRSFDYPVILDLPKPHLKGYPVESMISEKFEAMIKLGLLNSRMKDFYDIWLMIRLFDVKDSYLTEAIRRTFKHRKTELPKGLPIFDEEFYDEQSDRQILWQAFLNKNAIKNAPRKLAIVVKEIEKFLMLLFPLSP